MSRSPTSFPRYLFTGKLGRLGANLPSLARLVWRLVRDRRVSWLPKSLLAAILVYVLSPLDLLPEFVPILGAMDDLVVAGGGFWLFLRLCPPPVVREHVDRIETEVRARG